MVFGTEYPAAFRVDLLTEKLTSDIRHPSIIKGLTFTKYNTYFKSVILIVMYLQPVWNVLKIHLWGTISLVLPFHKPIPGVNRNILQQHSWNFQKPFWG